MSVNVKFEENMASEEQIAEHLSHCDAYFVPRLSDRVEIVEYAEKIANKAMRFEAWAGGSLVGLVAAYCNDRKTCISYVSSVSVLREWSGKGIAVRLMEHCIEYARTIGFWQISLKVGGDNVPAIGLYEKLGFVMRTSDRVFITMNLDLR
jgi:ribosomal protein S18 acetylase RimI-like enzyme